VRLRLLLVDRRQTAMRKVPWPFEVVGVGVEVDEVVAGHEARGQRSPAGDGMGAFLEAIPLVEARNRQSRATGAPSARRWPKASGAFDPSVREGSSTAPNQEPGRRGAAGDSWGEAGGRGRCDWSRHA